jgi:hypothetical protein
VGKMAQRTEKAIGILKGRFDESALFHFLMTMHFERASSKGGKLCVSSPIE